MCNSCRTVKTDLTNLTITEISPQEDGSISIEVHRVTSAPDSPSYSEDVVNYEDLINEKFIELIKAIIQYFINPDTIISLDGSIAIHKTPFSAIENFVITSSVI